MNSKGIYRKRIYQGTPKLYRARLVVPAVWLRHQPALRPWLRADYAFGSLQIQWRAPWE